MGVQNFVFIPKQSWPAVEEMNALLNRAGVPLQLPDDWLLSQEQLQQVNASSGGAVCVFDYAQAKYQAKDWDWASADAARFETMDYVGMFNAHSNAQEILGLMAASCAMTQLSKGVLFTPAFHDAVLSHDQAMPLLLTHLPSILEQFKGTSQLRSR